MNLGKTPPFRLGSGEILPGSIAEISYVRLGGMEQWVMVRGESIANPVLVFVQGGPGFPEIPFFRHFNAPLEKSFTVVYWEQRGAGKSFDAKIGKQSMTVEQFIRDMDELVESVRKRLGKDKVAVYGHSWGSALGVLYAARFPEKVAVYAGAGQLGDWPASEKLCYEFTLAEAERRGNQRALRQIRALGPPPYTGKQVIVQRKWLTRFVGFIPGISMWQFSRMVVRGPEFSIFDLPGILRGTRFSTETLWPEITQINLMKSAPALRMPVFFFLGRKDRVVAPETSVKYFEALDAPAKKLVWFENSGHHPAWEEPEKFNRVMVEEVRRAAS